jgi:hypothetical protein
MLAPEPSYQTSPPQTSSPPGCRGVSRQSVIKEAQAKVTTLELAARLSGAPGVQHGREIYFRCPLHDDHDPSLRVEPEQDVWFCDPCLVGGDVVELARFAWGYEKSEAQMAAADLLHTFGHEIPPRPASWYAKQERQRPVRNAIDAARFKHLRRRLFRRFFLPSLVSIEDSEERKAEAEAFWEATEPLARMMIERLAEAR